MLRFIKTLDINNKADHTIAFEDVPYVAIRLRCYAEKAATAITESNIGRVRMRMGSILQTNMLWTNLRILNDLLTGKPEKNEAGSGNESTFGIKIPLYHPEVPNAVHKRPNDNWHLYIEKFGVADCTHAKVDVYGEVDENMPESYIPKLHDYEFTASTGLHKISLKESNLAMLMLTKPATTVPTNIALFVDDDLYGSGDWYNWVNHTNDLARIEATALEVILMDLAQKRNFSDALSDSARLMIDGGVGSCYYMTQNIVFNTARSDTSVARVTSKINAKIQKMADTEPEGAVIATLQNSGIVNEATVSKVRSVTTDPRIRQKIYDLERRITATE